METLFIIKVCFVIATGVFIGLTLNELGKKLSPNIGAFIIIAMGAYLIGSTIFSIVT